MLILVDEGVANAEVVSEVLQHVLLAGRDASGAAEGHHGSLGSEGVSLAANVRIVQKVIGLRFQL